VSFAQFAGRNRALGRSRKEQRIISEEFLGVLDTFRLTSHRRGESWSGAAVLDDADEAFLQEKCMQEQEGRNEIRRDIKIGLGDALLGESDLVQLVLHGDGEGI
jgi:hypothetical protein